MGGFYLGVGIVLRRRPVLVLGCGNAYIGWSSIYNLQRGDKKRCKNEV